MKVNMWAYSLIILTAIHVPWLSLSGGEDALGKPGALEQKPADKARDAEAAPDGWLLVKQENWLRFANESSECFRNAREHFLAGDFSRSALSILKAAAFLETEADWADGNARTQLGGLADGLQELAYSVEERRVSDLGALESLFAQAELALAAHYHQKATNYEAENDTPNSMRAISASALHLLQSSAWAENDLAEEELRLAQEAHEFARTKTRHLTRSEQRKKRTPDVLRGLGRCISGFAQEVLRRVKVGAPKADPDDPTRDER